MPPKSYWTLSGFYACYFAVLGVWIPYWPLYMRDLGYGAEAVGLLTALSMGVKVLGPPVWGSLADRGSRQRVVIITAFAACFVASLLSLQRGLFFLLIVAVVFHFLFVAPLGLVEATTMEIVTRYRGDYGRIRLWGSWGFIFFALAVGPLTDVFGLGLVPILILSLLAIGAGITLFLPRQETPTRQQVGRSPGIFQRPEARWFFLSALLMQLSHGTYYGFMSIHLGNHGFSRTAIGALWAIAVVAEVILMAQSNTLLQRFGVSAVLTGSLLLAAVRWTIFSLTLWWPLLIFGQMLHAFSFAAFHVAAVRRVYVISTDSSRAMAQSWYSALSFGLGLGLGLIISGRLYDQVGAEALFAAMALFALLGAGASWYAGTLFVGRITHG